MSPPHMLRSVFQALELLQPLAVSVTVVVTSAAMTYSGQSECGLLNVVPHATRVTTLMDAEAHAHVRITGLHQTDLGPRRACACQVHADASDALHFCF